MIKHDIFHNLMFKIEKNNKNIRKNNTFSTPENQKTRLTTAVQVLFSSVLETYKLWLSNNQHISSIF